MINLKKNLFFTVITNRIAIKATGDINLGAICGVGRDAVACREFFDDNRARIIELVTQGKGANQICKDLEFC